MLLRKYGHENAEMQNFDDVTLRYSYEGHRPPSPVQNVTGYISSKKYARLPGEFEIRRRSGDLQIRPEIVGYVT